MEPMPQPQDSADFLLADAIHRQIKVRSLAAAPGFIQVERRPNPLDPLGAIALEGMALRALAAGPLSGRILVVGWLAYVGPFLLLALSAWLVADGGAALLILLINAPWIVILMRGTRRWRLRDHAGPLARS